MLKVNWSHEAGLKAPETKGSSIIKTYALAKPPTSDSSSNIFSTGYLLQDICFRIFASGYLLQNICFRIFASGYLLQNICYRIFASEYLLQDICAISVLPRLNHPPWTKSSSVQIYGHNAHRCNLATSQKSTQIVK